MAYDLTPEERALVDKMIEALDHLYYVHMIIHKADFLHDMKEAPQAEQDALARVLFVLDQMAKDIDRLQAVYGVEKPDYQHVLVDSAYVLEELPQEMEKMLKKVVQIARRNEVEVPQEISAELGA